MFRFAQHDKAIREVLLRLVLGSPRGTRFSSSRLTLRGARSRFSVLRFSVLGSLFSEGVARQQLHPVVRHIPVVEHKVDPIDERAAEVAPARGVQSLGQLLWGAQGSAETHHR